MIFGQSREVSDSMADHTTENWTGFSLNTNLGRYNLSRKERWEAQFESSNGICQGGLTMPMHIDTDLHCFVG
jgi:hypothetical protein